MNNDNNNNYDLKGKHQFVNLDNSKPENIKSDEKNHENKLTQAKKNEQDYYKTLKLIIITMLVFFGFVSIFVLIYLFI